MFLRDAMVAVAEIKKFNFFSLKHIKILRRHLPLGGKFSTESEKLRMQLEKRIVNQRFCLSCVVVCRVIVYKQICKQIYDPVR